MVTPDYGQNNQDHRLVKYVVYLKQKGMSPNQITQDLKSKGYNSSQIFNALNQPQKFPEQQFLSPKKPSINEESSNAKFILFITFIIILSIIIILTRILAPSEDKLLFEVEDLVFVSEADLEFQERIKSLTGYDWSNFLDADNEENAKVAALLFLAEEIGSLDSNFNFIDRSVGLNKSELPGRLDPANRSSDNIIKLIRNVKTVDNIFIENGLSSAQIRTNRLTVIENYFNKHSLPEGEVNEDLASLFIEIFGLTIDEYPRLVSILILNYNFFLEE